MDLLFKKLEEFSVPVSLFNFTINLLTNTYGKGDVKDPINSIHSFDDTRLSIVVVLMIACSLKSYNGCGPSCQEMDKFQKNLNELGNLLLVDDLDYGIRGYIDYICEGDYERILSKIYSLVTDTIRTATPKNPDFFTTLKDQLTLYTLIVSCLLSKNITIPKKFPLTVDNLVTKLCEVCPMEQDKIVLKNNILQQLRLTLERPHLCSLLPITQENGLIIGWIPYSFFANTDYDHYVTEQFRDAFFPFFTDHKNIIATRRSIQRDITKHPRDYACLSKPKQVVHFPYFPDRTKVLVSVTMVDVYSTNILDNLLIPSTGIEVNDDPHTDVRDVVISDLSLLDKVLSNFYKHYNCMF